MSHVLLNVKVAWGMMYLCECGKLLGRIERPYTELDQKYVWDLILAHREHARLMLGCGSAMRVGTTRMMPGVHFTIIDEAEARAMNEVLIKILAEVDPKPVIHSPP